MMKSVVVGGIIAFGALIGGTAQAADLAPLFGQPDEEEVLPPQQYTFGTGWYLRGDLTASDDREPSVLGTLPAKRDWGYGVGGGAGYQFTQNIRADLTGDFLSTQKARSFDGFGNIYKTNLRRFDGLANGYFDFGTWAGITPYIGAGVGFSGLRTDESIVTAAGGTGKITGKTQYDFAWAAMAGLAYHVSANLLVDVGYRYLDLGTYRSPYTGKTTTIDAHQIRAGLRYMIY